MSFDEIGYSSASAQPSVSHGTLSTGKLSDSFTPYILARCLAGTYRPNSHAAAWTLAIWLLGSAIGFCIAHSQLRIRYQLALFCIVILIAVHTQFWSRLRGLDCLHGLFIMFVLEGTIDGSHNPVGRCFAYSLLLIIVACRVVPFKLGYVEIAGAGPLLAVLLYLLVLLTNTTCHVRFSTINTSTHSTHLVGDVLLYAYLYMLVELQACSEIRRYSEGNGAPSADGAILLSAFSLVLLLTFSILSFRNDEIHNIRTYDGVESLPSRRSLEDCHAAHDRVRVMYVLLVILSIIRHGVLVRRVQFRMRSSVSMIPSRQSEQHRPEFCEIRRAVGACHIVTGLYLARSWSGRWRVRHKFYLCSSLLSFTTLGLNLLFHRLDHASLRVLPLAPTTAGMAACSFTAGTAILSLMSLLNDTGYSWIPFKDTNFRIVSTLKGLSVAFKLMVTIAIHVHVQQNCPRENQLTLDLCVIESDFFPTQLLHNSLIVSTAIALIIQMFFTFKARLRSRGVTLLQQKVQSPRFVLAAYFLIWLASKASLAVLVVSVMRGPQYLLLRTTYKECVRYYGYSGCQPRFDGVLPCAAAFEIPILSAFAFVLVSSICNELAWVVEPELSLTDGHKYIGSVAAVQSADGLRALAPILSLLANIIAIGNSMVLYSPGSTVTTWEIHFINVAMWIIAISTYILTIALGQDHIIEARV